METLKGLFALGVLGSLIGCIVWGALYHEWWPLAAWGGLFVLVALIGSTWQEDSEKDELRRRQLRELREKQDGKR